MTEIVLSIISLAWMSLFLGALWLILKLLRDIRIDKKFIKTLIEKADKFKHERNILDIRCGELEDQIKKCPICREEEFDVD